MAAPRETTWKLEPHTRAKHEILKRYLQAWMVILSQGRFPEILYIDGFSGPGEYVDHEVGSPIIALDNALSYNPPLSAKVHFLFIDKDPQRADHLRGLVENRVLPPNFTVVIEGGITFEAAFQKRAPEFLRNGRMMPTFAFIDPFGWTGVPFNLVCNILAQQNSEVFVNFMYEEVNRFISHPDQIANFTTFFGTDSWSHCASEADPRRRNKCLHDLYLRQLMGVANAQYVRSFEMSNHRDVTDYFLFYATNSLLGLKKMKEAMWKTDESGEFRFSDATNPNQLILFEKAPNFSALEGSLIDEFSRKEVSIERIEKFVVVRTAFRETHYKGILKSLEEAGKLAILNAESNRRRGTFARQDMVVRFDC